MARATLPIVTDSPSGKGGPSDLVLFDLVTFEDSRGRRGTVHVLLAPCRDAARIVRAESR
jgi:hypothetical protein